MKTSMDLLNRGRFQNGHRFGGGSRILVGDLPRYLRRMHVSFSNNTAGGEMKTLFSKASNTSAYAKVGILGFAGAGKTYTATRMAIGLSGLMKSAALAQATRPAFFLDTETGADWVEPIFQEADLELHTAKTRAFVDLLTAVDEAEHGASVLIVDSISHFWRELCDSHMKKKNRTRLEFQDWAVLKKEWGRFTDRFINSSLHIIMCGRAGFEYDYFEDADGKKQLEKTGIKMKAETETGYEPSLLVLMERHMDMDTRKIVRIATVLKDRSTKLDGKEITNPSFKDFLPHFQALNLGGKQMGVDTTRDSSELFDGENGDLQWRREAREKEAALDEITELLRKFYPGQDTSGKKARGDLLEQFAATRSWERVKMLKLPQVIEARNKLWLHLEGVEYGFAHSDVTGNGAAKTTTGEYLGVMTGQSPDDSMKEYEEGRA